VRIRISGPEGEDNGKIDGLLKSWDNKHKIVGVMETVHVRH
jgi:hypothetical protein